MRTRRPAIKRGAGKKTKTTLLPGTEGCYILPMGWVATGEERWPHGRRQRCAESLFGGRGCHRSMGRVPWHAERFSTPPAAAQLKTTLVILLTGNRRALWGHIGDQAVLLTAGKIMSQTRITACLAHGQCREISDEQIRFHSRKRLTGARRRRLNTSEFKNLSP